MKVANLPAEQSDTGRVDVMVCIDDQVRLDGLADLLKNDDSSIALRFLAGSEIVSQPRPNDTSVILLGVSEHTRALTEARAMRLIAPCAAIVVLTDEVDSRLTVDLAEAGVQDCLDWSEVTRSLLVRAISHALTRQRLTTELERRMAEVRAGELRFRSIIEKTADAIVLVDMDGNIRFVNPAAERLFGRSAQALQSNPFGFPLVAGETTELDILRSDGTALTAELRVVEDTWEGEPVSLASLRDITDRRKAEERARIISAEQAARTNAEASERRSRLLAEASTLLGASFDYKAALDKIAGLCVPFLADWCVIDLVERGRLRRVASVHAEPEIETQLRDIQRQRAPGMDEDQNPVARVIATGVAELFQDPPAQKWAGAITRESQKHSALGALTPQSLIIVPIAARSGSAGAITLAVSQSGRTYTPQELELAQEIARRAGFAIENARLYHDAREANQAKSDFLAVMSHELRTPLNAVLGYADLLLIGVPQSLPASLTRHVERIQLSAKHLLHIIDEILTFSRVEASREEVHVQRVSMRDVVSQSVSVVEGLAAEKSLKIHVELPDDPLQADTDPAKVRQILVNLLSNAVKFTEQGEIVVRLLGDGDSARFEVTDSGIGIAAEHRELIFEPFWQIERAATRRAGGTGLGLTVTRRLARLLGGDVQLETEVGRGSTFIVRLPLHSEGVPERRSVDRQP